MPAYLLTWNPKRWEWSTLHEEIADLKRGQPTARRWSTGNTKRIQPGDTLYLMRLGAEPRGIMAKGTAAGGVTEEPHWDPQRAAKGKTSNVIYVIWETLIDPNTAAPLPIAHLEASAPDQQWRPFGSGAVIRPHVVPMLERAWSEHLRDTPSARSTPHDDHQNASSRPELEPVTNNQATSMHPRPSVNTAPKSVTPAADWLTQSPMRERSLNILLADGTANGMRHVELSNWNGQAVICQRSHVAALSSWDECCRPGVYLLLGPSPSGTKLYVGEAEDVAKRVRQHGRAEQKTWFDTAVLFTNKDESLTKAHAKYLEASLVEQALRVGHIDVVNRNQPPKPRMPRTDRAAMSAYLGEISLILSTMRLVDMAGISRVTAHEQPSSAAIVEPNEPRRLSTKQGLESALYARLKSETDASARHVPKSQAWLGISTGRSGVVYRYKLQMHTTTVDLYVNTGDAGRNHALYQDLLNRRAVIESSFGRALFWDGPDSKSTAHVTHTIASGGYATPDAWDRVITETIEAMANLIRAVGW